MPTGIIKVKASEFGTQLTPGVVAVSNANNSAVPGGYLFSNVVGGGSGLATYYFLWVDTLGKLRIIVADTPPVEYDAGDNVLTLTDFELNSDGTIVGSQS